MAQHDSSPPRDRSLESLGFVVGSILKGAGVTIVAALAAGVLTYVARSSENPTYESVAWFAIVPSETLQDGTAADLVESVAALDRPIVNATVSELLQSGMVSELAAESIGLPADEIDLYDFSASEVPGSAVVRLAVTGPDQATTQALAQSVRDSDVPMADSFVGVFDVRSIDRATVPSSQIAPNPVRDAIAVALATAVLVAILVVLFQARKHARGTAGARQRDQAGEGAK